MKIQILAAFAAVCFCTPVAALAQESATSVRVSLAGADPSTPAGHAEAARRIHKAAVNLCRDVPGNGDRLMDNLVFEDCVKRTATPAIAALRPVTPTVEMAKAGR